jgi:AcrR family transcriptional regulator
MSNPKKTRNKEATIDKIYEKLFQLVLEVGYHNASTNKIAQAAEISVGTLYHHFPGGKKDIIRKSFENSVETTFDIEEFRKFDLSNSASIFKGFISNVLNNHKANKAYYIAFRSAILSDYELSDAHKRRVYDISKGIAMKLRETSPFFKSRPLDRLIRSFAFIYNIVNAVIYHHLVFMDLFEKDEDLIDYLSFICAQTIGYLQKKT